MGQSFEVTHVLPIGAKVRHRRYGDDGETIIIKYLSSDEWYYLCRPIHGFHSWHLTDLVLLNPKKQDSIKPLHDLIEFHVPDDYIKSNSGNDGELF